MVPKQSARWYFYKNKRDIHQKLLLPPKITLCTSGNIDRANCERDKSKWMETITFCFSCERCVNAVPGAFEWLHYWCSKRIPLHATKPSNKLDSALKRRIRSARKQVTSALNIYRTFSGTARCLNSPYTYRCARIDRPTCIFSARALWNKLQVLINHFVCQMRGQ